MMTTQMPSTLVTSFRSVAFHAMSSGDNSWSLDDRLRAALRRRPGWQVVRRRALTFVGGSVHGAVDVGGADWQASTRRPAICGGRGRPDIRVGTMPVRRESKSQAPTAVLLWTGRRYQSSRDEFCFYSPDM